MKKFLFVLAVCLLTFGLLIGSASAAKPSVSADSSYFDFSTGLYVLDGNVNVSVSNIVITAQHAKFSMTSMQVWATGGITATQGDISFYGDNANIKGFDRLALINGNVHYQRGDMTVTADRVEFNWGTKLATFYDNVTLTTSSGTQNLSSLTYDVANNQMM